MRVPGWGTRVYLWQIHVDIWQNQYNIVKLKKKKKIFLRCAFLLCSPSTLLGTREPTDPSTGGSAALCCVHLQVMHLFQTSTQGGVTPPTNSPLGVEFSLPQGCPLVAKSSSPSDQEIPVDRGEERVLGRGQLCMGCPVPDPEPSSRQASLGLQVSRTAMLISFCRKLWQRVCSES